MIETAFATALTIGIIAYIIRHYKLKPDPEKFSEGDRARVSEPHHPDYPRDVEIMELFDDRCSVRFSSGDRKILKQSDLTKQSL